MLSKVSGFQPISNNIHNVKAQVNPSFKGVAYFICNNIEKHDNFAFICRQFRMFQKLRLGQDVNGSSKIKGNIGTSYSECNKDFDKEFKKIAKKFAKRNGFGFKFRSTEILVQKNEITKG